MISCCQIRRLLAVYWGFSLLAASIWTLSFDVSLASEAASGYQAALDSIRSDTILKTIEFLADDRHEGREAGSRGGWACGDFLAKRFEACKLEPVGTQGFFQPFPFRYRNVLGLLRGRDPNFQYETIVVGAHYDHIGRGSTSTSRGTIGQIHNGADDNASGTAALIELAEAFALLPERPRRTILFVAWDAEEKGMLGSRHWVEHPTVAIENVVFALNMDMVGRLRNNTVYVFGTRSGFGLRRLLAEHNNGLDLVFDWTSKPEADYWPLFDRNIPYLMLNTGKHPQYHTENDDADTIDVEGERQVVKMLFATIYDLANRRQVSPFRSAGRYETNDTPMRQVAENTRPVVRLGVGWSEPTDEEDEGVRLTSVRIGSPAESAQLRPGDRILQLGRQKIRGSDELQWAVFHASGPTDVTIRRQGEPEPRRITAQLPDKRLRVGITWRVDSAAPDAVILTGVVPGSPAALAGLKPGDRIYQVAGRDFTDEKEFAEQIHSPGPLELLIERRGHLETVILDLDTKPLQRAA